jgi:hypothetical protein
LYLKPEHDFLFMGTAGHPVSDLLHDLKTMYDLRGVCGLKLAMDCKTRVYYVG